MKVPKPKKQKKDNLDKTMLDLWSQLIKIKAGFQCEYCGGTKSLNSHHIFSRSNRSVRWNIDNGICLCALHHILGNMSAHKAPLEFGDWIREKRGEKWYGSLKLRSCLVVKLSRVDKRAIMEELKAMIKELEG